jgi:putative ABC transport system permease protein
LLGAAVLSAVWALSGAATLLSFVSAFFILTGFALLTPALTVGLNRVFEPVAGHAFGIEGELALRNLTESLPRTAVTIAGLMVSVAMLIGLSVMVDSFRGTVDTWVRQTVKADLYIQPAGRAASGNAAVLPADVIEAARRLPDVLAVDTYRGQAIRYRGTTVGLGAVDLDILARHGNIRLRSGNGNDQLAAARAAGGVLVTESFFRKHGTREGDVISLETAVGTRSFRVFGVFYDYTIDAGGIMIDRSLYRRLWTDEKVNSIAIYLRPGADPQVARRLLSASVGRRHALVITPNQSLRERVMEVFDETFRITYALQAVAVVVAVLGIVNTLTALTLQRGREIGVLRAIGAFRHQVRKVVLVEAGMIGVLGTLIGSACGIALALLLIYVINRQFFGWSVRSEWEPWIFVQTFALIVTTSVGAGVLPARHAAARTAAEAMRLE